MSWIYAHNMILLFILFQFREVAFSGKHLRWIGEGATGEWEGQPGGVRGRWPHQVQWGRLLHWSVREPAGHHPLWSHRSLLCYAWLDMTSISMLYNKLCRFLYPYTYIKPCCYWVTAFLIGRKWMFYMPYLSSMCVAVLCVDHLYGGVKVHLCL